MKKIIDQVSPQFSRKINFLARMVIDNDYSRKMIKKEIDNRFYNTSIIDRENIFNKVLQRCYNKAWVLNDISSQKNSLTDFDDLNNFNEEILIKDHVEKSFVVKLTKELIKIIDSSKIVLSRGVRFKEDFYSLCLKTLETTDIYHKVNDPDLFLIYLKQLSIILRNSGILKIENNVARVNDISINTEELYLYLFVSFWNTVKWHEIFPSIPDAAKELKRNKNIIVDLILKNGDIISIVDISNEFFQLTGFCDKNNLVLISFLDFYFFTWLMHFGLIGYIGEEDGATVKVALTETGKRLFQYIRRV